MICKILYKLNKRLCRNQMWNEDISRENDRLTILTEKQVEEIADLKEQIANLEL